MEDLQVEISVCVNSIELASQFYCDELGLFQKRQNWGKTERSIAYIPNDTILLFLIEKRIERYKHPVFRLEVNDIDLLITQLERTSFKSGGYILTTEVFEYPVERNISLFDPSGNEIVLFESNSYARSQKRNPDYFL